MNADCRRRGIPLDLDAIADEFDPVVWGRGEAYAEAGMVLSLAAKADTIKAEVAGSSPYPYGVRLHVSDGNIDSGECTCPYGGWCKHMAAAAITAAHRKGEMLLEGAEGEDDAPLSDEELRTHLGRLSKHDLTELLVEHAAEDESLHRLLTEIATPAERVGTIIRDIRHMMRKAWGDPHGFIEYRESGAVANDLAEAREAIGRLAGRGHVLEAANLLEEFVESCERNIERADDSDGSMGDEALLAVENWGGLWAKIKDRDRKALAAKVLQQVDANDYGLKDCIITAFAGALGKEGLRELRTLLQSRLASLPKQKRKTRRGEEDGQSWQTYNLITCLKDVADALGEVDDYIRLCESSSGPERNAIPIATRLLNAGRPEEALTYLDNVNRSDRRSYPGEMEYPELRSAVLKKLGRTQEAFETMWEAFRETLDPSCLDEAIALAGKSKRQKLEKEALEIASKSPEAELALHFLAHRGALERAARLIDQREKEVSGDWYGEVKRIADLLAADYPAQAWKLLRILLADILEEARSRAYPHAARYYKKMAVLAEKAGMQSEQEALIQDLRKKHGRKRSFWARVGDRKE